LSGCVRLVFEKLAYCLLILFIFYFICVYVGLKVELLDRLVGWFDRNFGLIVFTVCFLLSCMLFGRLRSFTHT